MTDTAITEKINAVDIAIIGAMATLLNLKNAAHLSDSWKDAATKSYRELHQAQRTLQELHSIQAQNQVLRQIAEELFGDAKPGPLKNALWARYQRLNKESTDEQHTLCLSVRVPGRFALDAPDGPTLSCSQPIMLKRGSQWLAGYLDGNGPQYCFVPNGGNWRDDCIELREGDVVREQP